MAEETKIVTRREVTVALPVVNSPKWLRGFIAFIREQGVVGVAVGLTLGLASKSVVDSLVANILNPIISMLSGGDSLVTKYVCLDSLGSSCKTKLGYGQFLSDIIGFIVIAFVVYFTVKLLKLDNLSKKSK
jgi:large conductance mechanosensitive channel